MITILTYKDSWPDSYGVSGWRLCDSEGRFPAFPSSAAVGTASPTSVPIHDVLDHWTCGFGWHTYSDEAKATVMHGLRNGIDVRRSFELLAEDLIVDQQPSEPIDFFVSHRRLVRDPGRENPSCNRETVIRTISQMGRRNAIAAASMGLRRVGLEGIGEAQCRWRKLGLDFSLMGHIGHVLQELLEEAESIVAAEKQEFIDAAFEITPDICSINVASVGYRNSRQY